MSNGPDPRKQRVANAILSNAPLHRCAKNAPYVIHTLSRSHGLQKPTYRRQPHRTNVLCMRTHSKNRYHRNPSAACVATLHRQVPRPECHDPKCPGTKCRRGKTPIPGQAAPCLRQQALRGEGRCSAASREAHLQLAEAHAIHGAGNHAAVRVPTRQQWV